MRQPVCSRLVSFLCLLSVVVWSATGVARADSVARLKQKISRIIAAERLSDAQIGVYARVSGSGRVLYAKNADTPFIPASNFKLLTTATALVDLGAEFRFTTEVIGPPADARTGVIQGNLYLRGNGDPTMVEPWTRPATGPFEEFATELVGHGVHHVTGALVGDDSAFDREFIGKGWLRRYILLDYAAETAALSINGNVMHLEVRPDKVFAYPPTAALTVRRISSRGGFSVTRSMGSSCVVIQNCKPGKRMEASLTFHNPSEYTTGVFATILHHHGITFDAPMRLVNDNEVPLSAGYVHYATHQSAPLLRILTRINKHSDNLFADHVFKAIGWRTYGKGTLENSTRAVKEFLTRLGVDTSGLEIADGCGLSVLNRVTPRQFVELLDGMSRMPEGQMFRSTLPIAGKDGTMAGRLHGFSVQAKTGTIDGTCTLSGYATTRAGQQVCFSILVNHHHLANDTVRWMQDQIVKSIVLMDERL